MVVMPVIAMSAGWSSHPGRPGIVPRFVGHASQRIHALLTKPGNQEQGHQTTRNFHDGQHHRHIGGITVQFLVGHGRRGQRQTAEHADACRIGAGRVRAVVTGHRGGIDSPQIGGLAQDVVSHDANDKVGDKTDHHEAQRLLQFAGFQRRQFFAPLPTDRDQQKDGQTLIELDGKIERHLQQRYREPHVEEQQQGLEEVVPEVLPKAM